MDNRSVLFALHEMPGIGWKTIHKLFTRLSSLDQLLTLTPDHLNSLDIVQSKAELILSQLNDSFAADRMQAYRDRGIEIVTRFDPLYPEWLSQIAQPPWILYANGNTKLLNRPCIAMVGTRTPTAYGKKVAFQLAQELAESGMTVVSGLARGIDSEVHRGALTRSAAGSTIGVLGCALDTVYPPENKSLYAQVGENGLLLSEFPLGTPVHPGLFPMRNRIIAGLCLGTIVVEAADKSGSLITADQALEASRDVFAVPGPITSPKSSGTLSLIKQGAKTVTCVQDILEEYESMLHLNRSKSMKEENREDIQLTQDEADLLQHLSWEPATIDRLLTLSGFAFGQMHTVLLSLTMKKQIQQLPGSTFVRL
jgi:DNA processing protein